MPTRGLIARADSGGLGVLTWELARHVRFDKILVVFSMNTDRGVTDLSRYEDLGELRVTPLKPTPADAEWLAKDLEVCYTAETWYHPSMRQVLEQRQVRTVLHAMPELYNANERADETWAPTTWETELLPFDTKVIPVPVCRQSLPPRQLRDEPRVIYHVSSNAMADRNGTTTLLEAAELMEQPCEIWIRDAYAKHPDGSFERRTTQNGGRVKLRWLGAYEGHYFDHWPEEADLFVLPRRYGGLCLPAQEAASLGLPIVMTGLPPQNKQISRLGLVQAHPTQVLQMKGGQFRVFSCRPVDLARQLDLLLAQPRLLQIMAHESQAWAEQLDWARWVGEYERRLDELALS